MLHRKRSLLRAAAPVAVLALALTACGSNDTSDEGKKDAEAGTSQGGKDEQKDQEQQDKGPWKVGETASGTHEFESGSEKADIEITAKKVDTGKNADLLAAGLKKSDVKTMYPVFVHFTYTLKKTAKPMDDPDFNLKARVMGTGNEPGRKLITIGAADIKGGCPEQDDVTWKQGDTHDVCSTFLMAEGKDVEQVAWAGDLSNPLLWNVK